jgi:hypothetical protein
MHHPARVIPRHGSAGHFVEFEGADGLVCTDRW